MITFDELIDRLDAAVFSGDSLHDSENIDLLLEHCSRWEREAIRERESQKDGQ